ncbi:GNAT family N-acetyltransferase [Thalassomonas viridans]|uniref:Protein ElaA n=1 Tax=Thalassomonas viridans TaxID=137584 RepID=A0AAE9Z1Z3_9GAMM|nr:GNAT family N-acetyltransferase [Thalassomonas viridans]WDE04569.1 GNAT family N-acetyltransferase [Thalassomonas viridans]
MNWKCLTFAELTTEQLYELLKLRVDVFVVEQTCPYPELDDKDRASGVYHLLGYQGETLIAYARLLPAGISYDNVSFGRVAIAQPARGHGLGQTLMTTILQHCQRLWPNQDIDIGAQEYLLNFYQDFGFKAISEVYLEDDIPHLDMRLSHANAGNR